LGACGSSSKSNAQGSNPPATATSAAGGSTTACAPVADQTLVALTDDKHLQVSDNVVPVVSTKVAKAPLTDALNAVSNALSQSALVAINKSSDVDAKKPEAIATTFVADNKLGTGLSGGSGSITVVAADFSESVVLANIYADVLKSAGYSTSVKTLKNRELYLPALESGDVQVAPEYAATLTQFLADKAKDTTDKPSTDVTATIATLKKLATPKGLTVLEPAAATDENAFAVTKAFADKYALTTLSDLASKCGGGVTLGGPAECPTRPFCEVGLKSTYGLKVTSFKALDTGGPLSKNALKQGTVAVALVFTSDSSLTS
jgi:osmoprotectant transport system substrate-binding protein